LGAAIALLAILRPWTVRPLKTERAAFDAASYVEGVWTRLVDDAARSAVDLRGARDAAATPVSGGAPARRALFVRVTGTLVAVDRQSRVGLARLRPADEPAGEAVVQIGPVIRGTAVRDAARFIRFNDFSNQFEFAAVSNALHARLLRDVVAPVEFDRLVGQSLTVLGATTVQAGAPRGTPVDIVPIQIVTGGGPR
jgi:predicted lipoprotein